jgi:two-component system heavy metal sensor histidine kinase CusS
VEYSPEGSTISLTGRDDGDLLVVSNRALNLCREDLPKLFERMWRGDPSRTDSTHSGLGLSISLATAEALRLSLNAQLDDDSVLHIRIGEIEA